MRRLPIWKKEQNSEKRRKFFKTFQIFLMGLGILFICLFVFITVYFSRSSDLFKNERINFVLVGKEITLFSFSKSDHTATIVTIPSDLIVSLSPPYGSYRLGSIYDLDTTENQKGKLFLFAVSSLMGVPVQKFWDVPKNIQFENVSDVRAFFSLRTILSLKSFSDMRDFVPISNYFNSITSSSVHFISLQTYSFVQNRKLPDGSFESFIDTDQMDYILKNIFIDSSLISDGLDIDIINASDIIGLGSFTGRFLTLAGINVLSVNKSDTSIFDSTVCYKSSEIEKSYTYAYLSRLIRNSTKDCILANSRADITISIGRNFLDNWK